MINPVSLADAVQRIGRGFAYFGDPFTENGLSALGGVEGDITVDENFEFNDLTAPEWTGGAVHRRFLQGQAATATVPIVVKPGGDQFVNLSPAGIRGGGYSQQIEVTTTSIVIVPESEVGTGLSYDAGTDTWTPAAPEFAIWIWKALLTPGPIVFKHGGGGKMIREVHVTTMFDDARPEGYKLYYVGNPRDVGIEVLV